MYDELLNKQIIMELKELIEKADNLEEDADAYCALMKDMILRTYCEN